MPLFKANKASLVRKINRGRIIRDPLGGELVPIECSLALSIGLANTLGAQPMTLAPIQQFKVTTPAAADPQLFDTWYCGSMAKYQVLSTWEAPRIIVASFSTNVAGSTRFGIRVNDSDLHELRHESGDWVYYLNGVSQSTLVTAPSTAIWLYRQFSDGTAEFEVAETYLQLNFGSEPQVQLAVGWQWDYAMDPSAGLKAEGKVLTNKTAPDDEIHHADEGDSNWCGSELFVPALVEPAANQSLAVSGVTTLIERHAIVDTATEISEEPAANQTLSAAGTVTLLERHKAIAVTEEIIEEPAASQPLAASGSVALIERHTTS
jgi:hypothetical protein